MADSSLPGCLLVFTLRLIPGQPAETCACTSFTKLNQVNEMRTTLIPCSDNQPVEITLHELECFPQNTGITVFSIKTGVTFKTNLTCGDGCMYL